MYKINIFSILAYLLAITLLLWSGSTQGKVIGGRRVEVNMLLYENLGGGGVNIHYDDNVLDFAEVPRIFSLKGLKAPNWLCVETGVFLIYEQEHYFVDEPEEVHIISGLNKCTASPMKGIGSIRHSAGLMLDAEETPHMTVYADLFYGGQQYTVTQNSNRGLLRVQPVMSALIIGPTNWTVTTKGGDTFCLTTFQENPETIYVCAIPSFPEFFQVSLDDGYLFWSKETKGCSEGAEEKLVNTCFDFYSGEIQGVAISPKLPTTTTTTPRPGSDGANNATSPGSPHSPFYGTSCADFEDFAYLLKMRAISDFTSDFQFLVPKNKKLSWRTELLDVTFDVAQDMLATITIDSQFIPQIREVFVFFLEREVWSKGKGYPEKKPSHDILVTIHETQTCAKNLASSGFSGTISQALRENIPINGEVPEALYSKVNPYKEKKLDMVMEFVYQVFLIVSATCHRVNDYKTNYWLEYNQLFEDMYINPMVDYWADNGPVAKYYPIIFGGQDIDLTFRRVEAATKVIYSNFRYYELHPRPEKIANIIDS